MTISRLGRPIMINARKWLFTAFCLATFVAGHAYVNAGEASDAALTASKVFAEAPLEVLDMLRPSTRLDMLDYYNQADSILTATNALGGESRLVQVAPDYLKVEVTPVSTLEIKILRSGRKETVMTLYTVGEEGAARDTEVRFFDSDMKPLDRRKLLKAPKLADFFALKGSGVSEEELAGKIPFMAVEYKSGPGEAPLKATLTALGVISREDMEILSPLLSPPLEAPWKGSFRF